MRYDAPEGRFQFVSGLAVVGIGCYEYWPVPGILLMVR